MKTRHHSELTHGSFDITFNAFFGLYNWTPGREKFPTDEEIKKLLPLGNYKNVILSKKNKTVFLKEKGMKIGLGGMGTGPRSPNLLKVIAMTIQLPHPGSRAALR